MIMIRQCAFRYYFNTIVIIFMQLPLGLSLGGAEFEFGAF